MNSIEIGVVMRLLMIAADASSIVLRFVALSSSSFLGIFAISTLFLSKSNSFSLFVEVVTSLHEFVSLLMVAVFEKIVEEVMMGQYFSLFLANIVWIRIGVGRHNCSRSWDT